jgi:monovalent cation:H+ antiporter-2, CPA2 family
MTDPVLFIQDLAVILLSASICGYLCSRIGLSPVVGYLTAGLIVGTPEIIVPYVTDEHRIAVIAQLGVVFLMFSIGLQFRLHKVKELGVSIIIATSLTAILVLTASRFAADLLQLSKVAGLCISAVFMVSSSAIIGKIIQERGLGYKRYAQIAMGITLLEDIVAVVMLAVLGSYLTIDFVDHGPSPLATIGMLSGFAVLVVIIGLLIMPRILRALGQRRQAEVTSIFIAGTLLGLSLIAVLAGYSLALGAFLFGMIVAETSQRLTVERSFQGLKDVFLTVFFVTIGMSIKLQAFPGAVKWIMLGTAGALLGRSLAAFVSLIIVGEHPRLAMQSALCLTPIGEFSFIIAGIAVSGGLFSETFQVAAIGTALITSMVSPLLAANAPKLTNFISQGSFPRMDRIHEIYAGFWKSLGYIRLSSNLWKKLNQPLIRLGVEILIISSIVVFADLVITSIKETFLTETSIPDYVLYSVFWISVGLVCLIPFVAVWRNFNTIIFVLINQSNQQHQSDRRLTPLLSAFLKTIFLALFSIWIWNLLPFDSARGWILLIVIGLGLLLTLIGWRHMLKWHSQIELSLNEFLSGSSMAVNHNLFDKYRKAGWDLNLEELVLPDDTAWGGRTIMESRLRERTGCSIVGIERHGYALPSIGQGTHLFPGDQLLLLGSKEQITKARNILGEAVSHIVNQPSHQDYVLESYFIEDGNLAVGLSLSALNWTHFYQVQVVGLKRGNMQHLSLDAETMIKAGDILLLFGRVDKISALADSIAPLR